MTTLDSLRQAMKLAKMIGSPKPSSSAVSERSPLASSPWHRSPRSFVGTSSGLLLSPLRSPLLVTSSKAELESVFHFMDVDRDGQISPQELRAVLQSLGDDPSDEELEDMVKEVDSDGDGYISLDEFLSFNQRSMVSLAELRAAFLFFDVDGDGFISPDELHGVLVGLGEKGLTKADCGRMISGVDVNGDGFVDFEEFKVMMTKGGQ